MISFPNCKINLGLSVIEKRTDGFHNIETVFYPLKLCDVLEIIISQDNKFDFQISGIPIHGNSEKNLCIKTYELLKNKFNLLDVHIHLHKNIPVGAGLGGGSSDAVFTMKLLNELFLLQLSEVEQINYSKKIGSDCAFFVNNSPVFAYEKGDKFEPIDINLKEYYIVLVKPNVSVDTSFAYSKIIAEKPENSLKEIIKLPLSEWKQYLKNDFEDVIFKKFPEIEVLKNQLYDLGAIYSSMSGSGSAVYGIFKNKINIEDLFNNCFIWQGIL